MSRSLKRRLLLALAACAVLAGATAAVVMAAQPGSTPGAARARAHAARGHGEGLLATAASYLGVSREQLRSELRAGKTLAEIANATPGRSAAGAIQALEAAAKAKLTARATRLHARIAAAVDGKGPLAGRPARQAGLWGTAAEYLGISRSQLRSELRAGKTLAGIAGATPGKSPSGLIQALVAARSGAPKR